DSFHVRFKFAPQFGDYSFLVENLTEDFGVAQLAFKEVAVVRRQVNRRRDLGKLRVNGGRPRRDDDQVGFERIDQFIVRLEQRTNLDIVVRSILLQRFGIQEVRHTNNVNAQRVQRAKRSEVE